MAKNSINNNVLILKSTGVWMDADRYIPMDDMPVLLKFKKSNDKFYDDVCVYKKGFWHHYDGQKYNLVTLTNKKPFRWISIPSLDATISHIE